MKRWMQLAACAVLVTTLFVPCAYADESNEVITNVPQVQNVLVRIYRVDAGGENEPVPEHVSEAVKAALPEHVAANAAIQEQTVLRCRTRSEAEVSWSTPTPDDEDMIGPMHHRASVVVDKSSDTPADMIPLHLSIGSEIPIAEGAGAPNSPRRISRRSLGLSTSIDVPNGATVLVGKANLSIEGEPSWIFVSAELID